MEEVLGWQNTVSDFSDPTFMAQSLRHAARLSQKASFCRLFPQLLWGHFAL